MDPLKAILESHFGLAVHDIQQFEGEVNLNFKCILGDGKCFNIKLFHASTNNESIDFLVQLHKHFRSFKSIEIPDIKPWEKDSYIKPILYDDKTYNAIILEWIDGKLLSDVLYHPPLLLNRWGQLCAQVQQHLYDFDHPHLNRFEEWDPLHLLHHTAKIDTLPDQHKKDIIHNVFSQFNSYSKALKDLPISHNHNDFHTENILVHFNGLSPKIMGLIDFGDTLKTLRICDVAIACAYVIMEKKDGLAAVRSFLEGFTKYVTLTEGEIEVLDILIRARLSISVLISADKKTKGVSSSYQFISEEKAWNALNYLDSMQASFIHYSHRVGAGFIAHPNFHIFQEWCTKNRNLFKPVMDFQKEKSGRIDLSVASTVIPSTYDLQTVTTFEKHVFNYLEQKDWAYAYGGYGEIRPFYTTDNYEAENDQGYQWRTQHLGLDIWSSLKDKSNSKRKIFSPYQGKVICSHNNDERCDYGYTLILQHHTDEMPFYTLYGHLSKESMELSPIGKWVEAGDHIAYLGDKNENGAWPPHLHFQVLLDLLGNTTNYPGVCYPYEWKIWSALCPTPHLLTPYLLSSKIEDNSVEKLLPIRQLVLGKNLSVSYKRPLTILRGYMQYLYDESGRRYLDTVNNVAHVGHEHPVVTQKAIRQLQLLNTNTRYLHPNILRYAKKLLATFPSNITRVYFTNSGSEANELALRIAESYVKTKDKVVFEMGYHGNTTNTVDISSYKFDRKGGKGKTKSIIKIPFYKRNDTDSKRTYKEQVNKFIQGTKPLCFIGESILSCAGQVELDSEMLRYVYNIIQSNGGICIADEVQTGFGRIGSHFWAFQDHDVQPDIVTMGKPIGNGHPIGAVVCTEELAESFDNGMEYFNTYGGNPVSMAIAEAVLDEVYEQNLQAHAIEMEKAFYSIIKKLELPSGIQVSTRGKGLFLGIELMESGMEATDCAKFITNRMREKGILMSSDGPYENVLKVKPPMCFNEKDMKKMMYNLQQVLNEYAALTT